MDSTAFVKIIEERLDSKISNLVQSLMRHLQGERNRLVEDARKLVESLPAPVDASFAENEAFGHTMARLMKMPIGQIESNSDSNGSDDKYRKRTRYDGASKNGVNYEDVQIVATFQGCDKMGTMLKKPKHVVAMPEENTLALWNTHRMHVFLPNGAIDRSYQVEFEHSPEAQVPSGFHITSMTRNPISGQVVCVYRGQVHSFEPAVWGKEDVYVKMKQRTTEGTITKRGLACSAPTRQLFTVESSNIVSYSLADWTPLNKWLLNFPREAFYGQSKVLGVHPDGRLIYNTHGGQYLNAVPIEPTTGQLVTDQARQIGQASYQNANAVAFDAFGNIIVAHKGPSRIEVLSPTGEDVLGSFERSGMPPTFMANDIAFLNAPSTSEPFLLGDGSLRCPFVVVAPDYKSDQIVFFGTLLDTDGC